MKKSIFFASLVSMALMTSCTKESLVPEGDLPEWLGASIYEELKHPKSLKGTFETYLKLIDDLGYDEVLGKTGSKTIFPANDSAFAAFFKDGNNKFGKSSYEDLTRSEKAQLLFSSMIDNAVLIGNMSTEQSANGDMQQGKVVKHPTNISLLQSVTPLFSTNMPENNPYFADWKAKAKNINALYDDTEAPIVHFTGEYMLNNNMTVAGDGVSSDFEILTGSKYTDGDAYVFEHKVVKSDVTCQNGYIHQLNGVLVNPGNMASMLRQGKDTRHISRMLDYFAVPVAMDNTFNLQYQQYMQEAGSTQDSVFSIRYLSKNSQKKKFNSPVRGVVISDDKLLSFDPGWNYYAPTANTSSQAELAAILAPTDSVLEDYFSIGGGGYIVKNLGVPGLSYAKEDIKENINAHLDAIYNNDPAVFAAMLNNIMKPYLTKTVPSKFATVQNDAFEFLDVKRTDIKTKAGGKYDVQIANNGVIYRMNEFFAPKLYNSVLGPASIYKDMRVMGKMLNDHQLVPGTPSTLGADMYYYLLSMKAKYALFVPTDDEEEFFFVDPATAYDADGIKALKFYWNTEKKSTMNILVQRYIYKGNGKFEIDPNVGPVAIEKGYFNSQIADMLNYHTVVLPTTESGLYGNKYYLTKHGGAIFVEDGKGAINSTIQGGEQLAGGIVKPSKITEFFDSQNRDAHIENGTVYRIDRPIQPTTQSVYKQLEANSSKFGAFLEFCSNFDDEELMLFAGIVDPEDGKAQAEAKKKAFVIFGENNVLNMLSTYNYTIYVPENMQAAYDNGLPSWDKVMDKYNQYKDVDENDPECIAAKKEVKAMLMKMHDFVLYHIQNNSVFKDVNISKDKNQTFCVNSLGIAKTLQLGQDGDDVLVKDETGKGVKITSPNILARDVVTEQLSGTDTNDKTFSYKKIVSSAFVVMHGIEKPLCYNSNGKY